MTLTMHTYRNPSYENVSPAALQACQSNQAVVTTIARRRNALNVFMGILRDKYGWTTTSHQVFDQIGNPVNTRVLIQMAIQLVGTNGY